MLTVKKKKRFSVELASLQQYPLSFFWKFAKGGRVTKERGGGTEEQKGQVKEGMEKKGWTEGKKEKCSLSSFCTALWTMILDTLESF